MKKTRQSFVNMLEILGVKYTHMESKHGLLGALWEAESLRNGTPCSLFDRCE